LNQSVLKYSNSKVLELEYQILLGVIQKVETHLFGTLGKSVFEACQESFMLLWDMFSYCYMSE
jgi:hypothetical protein